MQNSQNFLALRSWTSVRRAHSAPADSPAMKWFFSSLTLSKNRHPLKIAEYGTEEVIEKYSKREVYNFFGCFGSGDICSVG